MAFPFNPLASLSSLDVSDEELSGPVGALLRSIGEGTRKPIPMPPAGIARPLPMAEPPLPEPNTVADASNGEPPRPARSKLEQMLHDNLSDMSTPGIAVPIRAKVIAQEGTDSIPAAEDKYWDAYRQSHRGYSTGSEPMANSDVQNIVAKQKEQEYLTGNPGMRRHLAPVQQQERPQIPLLASLTKNVRSDNGKTYGEVAGRDAIKNAEGNWAIQPRARSTYSEAEKAEWQRTHTPEHKAMLSRNAAATAAKQAEHDAKLASERNQRHADRIRLEAEMRQAAVDANKPGPTGLSPNQIRNMVAAGHPLAGQAMQADAVARLKQAELANDREIARMTGETQRAIHDPYLQGLNDQLVAAQRAGDRAAEQRLRREAAQYQSSKAGGGSVVSQPSSAAGVDLHQAPASDEMVYSALNRLRAAHPDPAWFNDPANRATVWNELHSTGISADDLNRFRQTSPIGDVGAIEWWDKYLGPLYSNENAHRMQNRRANSPLLDSLLAPARPASAR